MSLSFDTVLCPAVELDALASLRYRVGSILTPASQVEVGVSGCEVLDAPYQPGLALSEGCEGDGEHGGEAEGGLDGDLLQASDPEAAQHEPLLRPAEQPLHAHPPFEELHQPAGPAYDEVRAREVLTDAEYRVRSEHPEIRILKFVDEGQPSDIIIEVAESDNADLIVIRARDS